MRGIKRGLIGLLTLAMLILPNITQAHPNSRRKSHRIFRGLRVINRNVSPIRTQTGWNPYAFTHKTSGLISGHYDRSFHAFSHKNPSGLAPRDVRYSPYAFNTKHNGLIQGHSHTPHNHFSPQNLPPYTIVSTCGWPTCQQKKELTKPYEITKRKENIKEQDKERAKIREIKRNDVVNKVYDYLKTDNINFRKENSFSMGSRVISADFILPEQGKVIKFLNFDEINNLKGFRKTLHENYMQRWKKDEVKTYKQAGLEIQYWTHGDASRLKELTS
jgi:hypothetical protein